MGGLTKSLYCSGIQCPKMLWLKENRPELEEQRTSQTIFDNGNKVGDLAKGLLGNYTEVNICENKQEMICQTEELIEKETEVICEASFAVDGLFCSLDLLHCLGNGTVDFYEVKSSTGLKDVYYRDASFQLYVLRKLGYRVQHVYLVHVDNSYVLDGELDIHRLLRINDVTDSVVAMQNDTARRIAFLKDYLRQECEPEQELHGGCFSPYACNFWNYCARYLPEYNVFDLYRMQKEKMLSYYYDGVVSFEDLQGKAKLSEAQRIQVETVLDGRKHILAGKVAEYLKEKIRYPLYFLDFESFQPAIPLYQGTRPYQQMAFQYSLHIIRKENDQPEDAEHFEFIAEPEEDPRRSVAERLCLDIPEDVCVLAYNMSFEKGRIREMAEACPDLAEHLMAIHNNIEDLITPFKSRWVYYPVMNGSSSIKEVLPALFPDDPALNYHNLEGVHKGDEASAVYDRMAEMNEADKTYWKESLFRYCELDTFAMVKIWQKLREIAEG